MPGRCRRGGPPCPPSFSWPANGLPLTARAATGGCPYESGGPLPRTETGGHGQPGNGLRPASARNVGGQQTRRSPLRRWQAEGGGWGPDPSVSPGTAWLRALDTIAPCVDEKPYPGAEQYPLQGRTLAAFVLRPAPRRRTSDAPGEPIGPAQPA